MSADNSLGGSGQKLLNRDEVAARLGVSVRTLRRVLLTAHGLRPIQVGRRMLFTERDFAALVESLRRPLPTEAVLGRRGLTLARARPEAGTAQDQVRDLCTQLAARRRGGR